MAGGIGGFIAFPYTHLLMEMLGWKASLLVLLATAARHDAAGLAAGRQAAAVQRGDPSRRRWARPSSEAFAHPSFWLLIAGFFVCGFHVAFYGVHLPAFVADKGLAGRRRRVRR